MKEKKELCASRIKPSLSNQNGFWYAVFDMQMLKTAYETQT
jgi:hypothetical protein